MSFLPNYCNFNFDKVTFETYTNLAIGDKINILGTINNTSAVISNGSIILNNNSIWKLEAIPMFNYNFTTSNNGVLLFSFNDGVQNIGMPSNNRSKYKGIYMHGYASLFLTPEDFTSSTMTIDMICTNLNTLAVRSVEVGDGTPYLNIIEIPID